MNKLFKKVISIMIFSVIIFQNATILVNANTNEIDKYCKSSILIDQDSGRILHFKNANEKRPLASLSKMMTFLIAIEAIESKKASANDVIIIEPSTAAVGGSSYKLKANEKVKLIDLMRGLMIVSGNDAAVAIAKHIGKDVDSFVGLMNQKAAEIGMKDTHFVNPHGLPIYSLEDPSKPPKENISTAKDISTLGKYMFDNYEKAVTSVTDMQVYTNPQRGFCKNNTNALLSIFENVDGIKTGYTGNAGYCLSFSMKVNDQNKDFRIIGVVLGAKNKESRISSSVSILKYGQNNFQSYKLIEQDEFIGKRYIKNINDLEVKLKIKDELWILKNKNESIKTEVTLKELKYPIAKGDVLGIIKYYSSNGEFLGKSEIISENDINKISFINKIKMLKK